MRRRRTPRPQDREDIPLLSVVVTGRNDAHGYNLHKRIALSLNCLTEALSGDDEIVFVDWNSPDEMPTVVEAIADTLTEPCRARLRVLRVRPEQHRRACGLSHLPLIDAIARNVGIRRARADSRWVLSTSTDVILVPRQGEAFAEIVPGLAPGLYQVPRFDIPEALWEALDRRDPVTAIARCAEWAAALHLNEIVEADPIVKYDGPGDFQLFPMAAARQLGGYDERMVLTYHTDANFIKRARYVLGPVRTLVDRLFLYHCNHYRQISVHHGPVRAENPWQRFFVEVNGPDVPGQADRWGLAGEAVEEIELPRPGRPRMAAALSGVMSPANEETWVSVNRGELFNSLDYHPEHVLPFVADLLQPMPRDATLGVFAAGTALVRLLAAARPALGFTRPILASDPRLAAGGVEMADEAEIFGRAAVLLFEFGADGTPEPFADPSAAARLAEVADTFRRAVAAEAGRIEAGSAARQRFIVVNAVNTVFERLVANNLSFTYTPFSGRVRHGTVARPRDPLSPDVATLAGWLGPRLGRPGAVPYQEVVEALDAIGAALAADEPAPAMPSVLGLLDHPRLPAALGADAARWPTWAETTRRARPSEIWATRLSVRLAEPALDEQPAVSKLAAIEDWERPGWLRHLVACGEAAETAEAPRRHRSTWEIGQFLYAIAAADPERSMQRAAIILRQPHPLASYLSGQFATNWILPASTRRGTPAHAIWPYPGQPYDAGRFRVSTKNAAPPDGEAADLIALPDNAILAEGLGRFPANFERLDRWLAPEGVVVCAIEVVIAGGDARRRLPAAALANGELDRVITEHTGFAPLGAVDWRISPATLDRLAVAGTERAAHPHFVLQVGDLLSTTAVVAWRKKAATSRADWAGFARAFAETLDLGPRGVLAWVGARLGLTR